MCSANTHQELIATCSVLLFDQRYVDNQPPFSSAEIPTTSEEEVLSYTNPRQLMMK